MMLNVLNADAEVIGVIDAFSSLIWTKRYYECGDFELYLRATDELWDMLRSGIYVSRDDDDMMCLIESIAIDTDVENGNYLTVKGRCLKSILDRRIVWYQTTLYGRVEECVRRLIDMNAINPRTYNRKIIGLTLGELQGYTETMEQQLTGANLYESVSSICKSYSYGFQIAKVGDNFVFDMLKGTDRSYDQTENPYVVFSAEFDNLPRSNYEYHTADYKNTALVAGEGEGLARRTSAIEIGSSLTRREIYVDARDISSNEGEINDAEYLTLLNGRGYDKLSQCSATENIDGEVETSNQYIFGTDYFLGDIVQIKNEYGMEAKATVIEVIECEDETGHTIIPTFSSWEFN